MTFVTSSCVTVEPFLTIYYHNQIRVPAKVQERAQNLLGWRSSHLTPLPRPYWVGQSTSTPSSVVDANKVTQAYMQRVNEHGETKQTRNSHRGTSLTFGPGQGKLRVVKMAAGGQNHIGFACSKRWQQGLVGGIASVGVGYYCTTSPPSNDSEFTYRLREWRWRALLQRWHPPRR